MACLLCWRKTGFEVTAVAAAWAGPEAEVLRAAGSGLGDGFASLAAKEGPALKMNQPAKSRQASTKPLNERLFADVVTLAGACAKQGGSAA
jgi:hypothetical protein